MSFCCTPIGANNQRYDGLVKLGYSFSPKASIGYSSNACHDDSNGKNTDITDTAASGYDYAAAPTAPKHTP